MEKLKRIERKLEEMTKLQKQLEKKRKKLVKAAAKAKKQVKAKSKALAGKAPKTAEVIVGDMVNEVKKKNTRGIIVKSILLAAVTTMVAVAVSIAVKRFAVQQGAEERASEATMDDVVNNDYEKASLEELEEALLRVENQLDEVTSAIENSKK